MSFWAAGISTAVSVGTSAYSYSKAKGAKSNLEGFEIPEFEENENFNEMQTVLKDLGVNLLKGDIPDFYKEIGQAGGKEFEKYLDLSKAEIGESVLESSAATGRRGGSVQSITAEKVGEADTKARYANYLNAIQGKQYLLNKGTDLTTGVRTAASGRESRLNNYGLKAAGMDLDYRNAQDRSDMALGEAEGQALASLTGSVTDGITSFSGLLGKIPKKTPTKVPGSVKGKTLGSFSAS